MKQYILEMEEALSVHPKRTSAQNPESYIGGGQSKLRYIGLRVPHLDETMKKGFSFSQSEEKEIIKIWDYIWNESDCYEVMSLALTWFDDKKQVDVKHWPLLRKWSARIDNWAHSDTLSGIYAKILEKSPALVYPTFEKWNQSKNPWLRRQSIVSLLYYSSQRKKVLPLKKILSLVEPLLEDEHYYVQKGVGWTLRETGNIYPKETYNFLEKNILKLSSHAFTAATEKLSKPQKGRLKKLRKNRKR